MIRNYYLKPAPPDFQVTWDGGVGFPGPNNFGTESAPVYLSAGAINSWIYAPDAPDAGDTDTYQHYFHLFPGEYCIGPATSRDGRYLQGADSIFLQNNTGRPNRFVKVLFHPYFDGDRPLLRSYGKQYTKEETDAWPGMKENCIFFSPEYAGYLHEIQLINLDLDFNWENQGYAAYGITKGFKGHCVQIRANWFQIRGCRLINSGCNSNPDTGAIETFPLNTYSATNELNSGIIEDCEISKFHSANGGYATGISVNPFTHIPEPRPVTFWQWNTPQRGSINIVRRCHVLGMRVMNGCGASGSGVLASRDILFEHNVFEGCSIAGNFDTGGVWGVQFNNNTIIDCNAGLQMGSPTGNALANRAPDPMVPPFMYNFMMRGNRMRIKRNDVQLAKDCPDRAKACFLHIRNNSAGVVAQNNEVWTVEPGNFATWVGATDVDRYWRFINLSGIDPYSVPGYYGGFGPANNVLDNPVDQRFSGNMFNGRELIAEDAARLFGKRFVTEAGDFRMA